ncbi:MAG: alpha-(1-_3)-arabinofuranosyltransferase family protein [Candidatus Levybacteria bacterium]|nr:alpha-(1->3)-arabinofuranosyltransferase family protein [Candidatus Levybacteria bacterium]
MQKIKNFLRSNKLQDILFIFLVSLTPLLWFRKNEIIVGHDNVFALNPLTFLQGRLFTWVEHGFGQSQDLIMGTIPIHLIDAVPYVLGLSVQNTEKIVYVFWFFMMGISAYILASIINPRSRIFQLVAVLLYQFNFFILQAWWIGERTKFSAYTALPLLLAIFLSVYRNNLSLGKAIAYSSLVLFIFNAGGLYGIPLYGGLFISIGIFILMSAVYSSIKHDWKAVERMILLSVFSCVGFFLVNSYYLFPLLARFTSEYSTSVSSVGGVAGLIEWANTISANTSYINLMRLQGIPEWYDNIDHPYAKYFLQNPLLVVSSFVWPLLLMIGLFKKQEKGQGKLILVFFFIYLVGIIFAAGTHKPLGGLYAALMNYIPGFAVFRSPYYKFAPAIFLASSFLIAYGVSWLNGKKRIVGFAVLMFFILLYHFPYFTGDIFSWKKGFSTRLTIPEYVFNFGEWLNKEKDDEERVLMLPPNDPNFRYSKYNWGYLSYQSLPTLLSNQSIVINNDRVNDNELKMMEGLYQALINRNEQSTYKLASSLGIGYILLQEDVVLDEDEGRSYKEALEGLSRLSIVKKFGAWFLYKIDYADPSAVSKFFTNDKVTLVSGPIKHLGTYLSLNDGLQTIIKKEDLGSIGLSIGGRPSIYSPNCLKCKKKDKPFVNYSNRNFLPDSPFYALVLFSEEQKLRLNDPKSLVYDYTGLMLKRFTEIKEMIEKDIEVKNDYLNRLEAMIGQIQVNFKLIRNQEKFDVAEDLKYYIDDLRDVTMSMLGDKVRSGLPVVAYAHILSSIGNLELDIDQYLFKEDITQNRLYSLEIDQSGKFDIYIQSKEFENIFRDKSNIKIQFDDKKSKELIIDPSTPQPQWLSLGDIDLQKGDHAVLLSFGEIVNLAGQFSPSATEFNSDKKTECLTTALQNYDSSKQYKMIINYKSNPLSDINMYIWELKEEGKKIQSADRIRTSLLKQEFARDIKPNDSVKGIIIGMCSPGLTSEYFQDHFTVNVREFIEPVVVFVSKNLQTNSVKEVSYQKINPTKYTLSFTTSTPDTALIFSSRFDKGWSLQGFERKHVSVNGFANGWLIEKPGNYSLTLEYKPQGIFQIGGLVSLSSVLIAIVYIVISTVKERRKTNNV